MRNLILLLLISSACQGQPKDFDARQVTQDINSLKSELERYHAGLYRYCSKEQMDQYFDEATGSSNGLNGEELYAQVTFLLSQVKCGHTRASMPANMRSMYHSDSRFLPFGIVMLGDEPYVSASLDKDIPEGARLTRINGKTFAEIEQLIFDHLAADGFITTGKRRMISRLFSSYYQLYVDGEHEKVDVEYITADDQITTRTIDRIPYAELETLPNSQNRRTTLAMDHSNDHSYMRISTFGQQSLANAGLDYEAFLAKSFSILKSRGVENLILDLRGNGGGRDNYGALLVSYLLPKEFGYFDNIQVTFDYEGHGGVVAKAGKRYVTSHQGLTKWKPQADVFEGNLYILIDGGSFSTCADVATVLHHNDRGVFLGQETGGGYDGNTSGNTRSITLPNSNIKVYVPMWKYTTANIGHQFPGRGVIPDHEIIPNWEQFIINEDVVLKKTLDLIRD